MRCFGKPVCKKKKKLTKKKPLTKSISITYSWLKFIYSPYRRSFSYILHLNEYLYSNITKQYFRLEKNHILNQFFLYASLTFIFHFSFFLGINSFPASINDLYIFNKHAIFAFLLSLHDLIKLFSTIEKK